MANPGTVPLVWMGSLFSVLCLGVQTYLLLDETSSDRIAHYQQSSDRFYVPATRIFEALIQKEPETGMVEFHSLLLHAKFSRTRTRSMNTEVLLMAGDVVRLAMSMGYHRDPSNHRALDLFESEMRRRVWAFVSQTDLLFSMQMGLPPAVRGIESDTMPMQNYREEDLFPGMTALPPPGASNELTFISYLIAKRQLFQVFREIVEEINSLRPTPYRNVLAYTARLDHAYSTLPSFFQRSFNDSVTDHPRLVLQRIQLEMIYHKIRCVLHRPYLGPSFRDQTYQASRDACVESGLRLIACQETLHNNIRWKHVRWYTLSLNNHVFMLAGTILCLYMYLCVNANEANGYTKTREYRNVSNTLDTSLAIWTAVKYTSPEAQKAHMMLTALFAKVKGQTEDEALRYQAQREAASSGRNGVVSGPEQVNGPSNGPNEELEYHGVAPFNFIYDITAPLDVGADIDWVSPSFNLFTPLVWSNCSSVSSKLQRLYFLTLSCRYTVHP